MISGKLKENQFFQQRSNTETPLYLREIYTMKQKYLILKNEEKTSDPG
jgi:hypothetical protein